MICDCAAGSMSLCWSRPISPPGVVRDLDTGFLRMEFVPIETEAVWIVAGRTYPFKDELRSLGFRWNAANKVWYQLGDLTEQQYDFLLPLIKVLLWQGVYLRCFNCEDHTWRETTHPDSPGPPIPLDLKDKPNPG